MLDKNRDYILGEFSDVKCPICSENSTQTVKAVYYEESLLIITECSTCGVEHQNAKHAEFTLEFHKTKKELKRIIRDSGNIGSALTAVDKLI